MRDVLYLLALGVCANALAGASAFAQAVPEITLTRLDCGTPNPPTDLNQRFSDTYAYAGKTLQLVYSCYLIKHGNDYMVWDSGHATTAGAVAPKVPLPELLGKLELKPEQIKYIGISHYHGDHIGQVGAFPKSTLLIGKGDWDVLVDAKAATAAGTNNATFANWINGGGKVEPVRLDQDVFGDGTVLMLNTPGHTPGHHVLLVKLKEMGPVILSGDMAHFRENYDQDGVPTFNTDRSQTIASIERVKQLAKNLNAKVIIQHDPRDVDKLPAFPAAAK
ncbi:MAG: N-acyl homoserine lactonase family protein [Xanthobacteraceae bacterium]|nr:N-acyl homoserine lactonase family protein [Xanthobacteraceae bacterium]